MIHFQKTLSLSVFCSKCENENEKIFKEEESIEIIKILDIIKNTSLKICLKKT